MILVTVGNLPFDRLVRAADELARLVDETVIIQGSHGAYRPQYAEYVQFVDENQIQKWVSEATVVIAHAGAGTILGVLASGKPLILTPRMASLGEHIDDHQFELAQALVERGWAVMLTELSGESLVLAMSQAQQLNREGSIAETALHSFLRGWLAAQAAQPPSRRWSLFRRQRKEA